MKTLKIALAVLLLGLVAACSSQTTTHTDAAADADGTLVIREKGVLRIASGGAGTGTLTLRGWEYPFEVSNMVLSGIGPGELQLEGDVFNVADVNDFEGTYNVVSADVQSGQGAQGFVFENEKGVRVHIRASGQDLTVRLDGNGSTVRLVQ
jgi:hypothetical protein